MREQGAHTSCEGIIQLCPCQPDFHSGVFFCFMPYQVMYASEGWLDFYTTVLLWAIYYLHGMAKRRAQEKSHMSISSSPQMVL